MLEPLAAKATIEAASAAPRLIERLLGPSADFMGEDLRDRLEKRKNRNRERMLARLHARGIASKTGDVPLRVLSDLWEQSGLADDEVMAEYLSGMFAASVTPGGRDDRAITWSSLLKSMSALQIRTHFVLYRTWSRLLKGRSDLSDGMPRTTMLAPVADLIATISNETPEHEENPNEILLHAIAGIARLGLVQEHFGWGRRTDIETDGYHLYVRPTASGIELFGWAAGASNLHGHNFGEFVENWSDFLPDAVHAELAESDHTIPVDTAQERPRNA